VPKRRVRRLSSDLPEARDEGPRLLPLQKEHHSESRLDYYLALADQSLKSKAGKKQTGTKTAAPHPAQRKVSSSKARAQQK